jgi:hypothetical protein
MSRLTAFFTAWWRHHKQTTWMALGAIFGALELHSDAVRTLLPEHLRPLVEIGLAAGGAIIANLPKPPPQA